MRSKRGSRRIVVENVEYRWRAKGDDGWIAVGIWPANDVGPYIQGNLRYYETWIDQGDGCFLSAGDQIVVTSRIIRRIIELALTAHAYNPNEPGEDLNFRRLDDVIDTSDAIRAVSQQE